MTDGSTQIDRALSELVGLPLSEITRAADMRILHFGEMHPMAASEVDRLRNRQPGIAGEFTLHIQCPWRFETDDQIITGRSDLWEPCDGRLGKALDDWNWEVDGNVQDSRIAELLSNPIRPIVKSIAVRLHGAFTLSFQDDLRLLVFPAGVKGEDWRLCRTRPTRLHFVVSGGMIQQASGGTVA